MDKKSAKIHAYRLGLFGEALAMLLYRIQLYCVIAKRFKTKFGEIDFICTRANTLVFVEVKSRSFEYDQVICSKDQQARIVRAAEFFLLKNKNYQGYKLKFDLVLIRTFCFPKIFRNFIEL